MSATTMSGGGAPGTGPDFPGLTDLLAAWLPGRRWYAGKGREITGVELTAAVQLTAEPAPLHHIVVAVEQADPAAGAAAEKERAHYQLLIGLRPAPLPERLEYAAIGPLGGDQAGQVCYDAMHDPELTGVLLDLLAAGGEHAGLHFGRLAGAEVPTGLTSRVMTAEQSNTSVVYGDQLILKLFRRVSAGLNPDLEITRALAGAGSPHVAKPLGWIEGSGLGLPAPATGPGPSADAAQPATLAILQEFLGNASEGWDLAKTSVRDLLAEGDLHADEVGGDFAAEAERLGAATARVHADLARLLPTATFEADDLAALAGHMHLRLEQAAAEVPELTPYAGVLGEVFDQLGKRGRPLAVQRIHGDYHLGQVLRTIDGWVLLDFEGEPAKPLAERRALGPVARDVAGMLRSFDYAAHHLLPETGSHQQREYRANEWAERNSAAFCEGYAAEAGTDPRDDGLVLDAFEIDKAVYEAVYEARNRPAWLPIPMAAIERLAAASDRRS